jgi:predicted GNAT superfamily acetyltransferase
LYADLFRRASENGHSTIACEVNAQPPNPTSDAFHAALGFVQVGTATFDDGAKTVRYLVRQL